MAKQNKRYDSQNSPSKNSKDSKRKNGRNTKRKDSKYQESKSDYGRDDQRNISNDPAWWMRAGQLSKDTSSISTYTTVGGKQVSPTINRKYFTPSGVAKYEYVPFYGHITSPTDPINVSAKIMYDMINTKNSRNPSYDPSDLMMYVIGVANAWALHSVVMRIVGMFNTYSTVNRYWWRSVAETMNVTPISTQEDIITWRNLLNRMALKLNMLSVPNGIAYFNRAIYLGQGIYADSPTQKASLYYFMPRYLFKYQLDDEGLGELVYSATPFGGEFAATPASVEEYFNSLTEELFNNSDINTMCADIRKAYGDENCFKLPQVDENYTMAFQYVPEVNLQLHNARIFPFDDFSTLREQYTIGQDMTLNCIAADASLTASTGEVVSSVFHEMDRSGKYQLPLDFSRDDVTNEDVIEATRFMWTYKYKTGVDDVVIGCTELIIKDTMYTFTEDASDPEVWTLTSTSNNINVHINNAMSASTMSKLEAQTKYHDCPISYLINGVANNLESVKMIITSDLTNYTTISQNTLRNMHDACTLSIFSPIPLG